jgi:hypothetical protein
MQRLTTLILTYHKTRCVPEFIGEGLHEWIAQRARASKTQRSVLGEHMGTHQDIFLVCAVLRRRAVGYW